jgi:hypothetical protein
MLGFLFILALLQPCRDFLLRWMNQWKFDPRFLPGQFLEGPY